MTWPRPPRSSTGASSTTTASAKGPTASCSANRHRRELDKLERLVETQQRQLAEQKKQLDALMRMVQDLQAQKQSPAREAGTESATVAAAKPSSAAKTPASTGVASVPDPERKPMSAPPAKTTASLPEAADKPLPEIGGVLSQDWKHERITPTGANVSSQQSRLNLPIPGTQTEIGISGFAMLQAIHDTVGTNNCEFDTILIPVDGAPAQTKFCVNPSRLLVTSKSGIPAGRVNTALSIDFNGQLDTAEPRLRVAYGEWINDEKDFALLGGQTFSTMLDLKSVPETLDFAGPTGYFPRRQPLFRFTKLFGRTVLAEVALRHPKTSPTSTPTNAPAGRISRSLGPGSSTAIISVTSGLPDLPVICAPKGSTDRRTRHSAGRSSGRQSLSFHSWVPRTT